MMTESNIWLNSFVVRPYDPHPPGRKTPARSFIPNEDAGLRFDFASPCRYFSIDLIFFCS